MAEEGTTAPTVTTDSSGINRTEGGEITTTPATEGSNQNTNRQTQTDAGTTLLTEGEKKPEVKPETKPDAKGPPETYAAYKLPEGYSLDENVSKEANALFKGMGLNQDQAQSLVDFYVKTTTEAFQQPFNAYQEMTDGWKKDAMDHPDLRGKLGKDGEVQTTIAKAYNALGNPQLVNDFKELMDLTGAGNHQAFIRMIYNLAKPLAEGTHVAGNGPTPGGQARPGQAPPSAAAAIWPNLTSANRQ